MKLSKKALKKIEDRPIRLKLAIALDFSEQWINKLVDRNEDDSPLTLVKSLQIIEQETGLTQSEILHEETVKTL